MAKPLWPSAANSGIATINLEEMRLEEMTLLRKHGEPTRIVSDEYPIRKYRAPERRIPTHPDRAWLTGTLPKFLPPFWRTLLGLVILPPLIASFFIYHVEMMTFLYHYTPFTAQNVALIIFRDTD